MADAAPAHPSSARTAVGYLSIAFAYLFCAAAVFCLIHLAFHHQHLRLSWSLEFFVFAVAFLTTGFEYLSRRHHWILPLRQLHTTLDEIRAGEAPIDELSRIQGHLAPLAGSLQAVLHELRQQQTFVAQLERQIDQRVSQRTDA